jgi:hypothetical protein
MGVAGSGCRFVAMARAGDLLLTHKETLRFPLLTE